MESQPMNPIPPGPEPELNLLIADKQFGEPLYRSLFRQLDEFFFPKKLPPLTLESKPEPVKDLWGFYSYWKVGAAGAAGYYALIAVAITLGVLIARRVVAKPLQAKVTMTLLAPDDLPVIKPGKT